jgi:large subunit ribosomal protein L28
MAKCLICDKKVQTGNNVSHSHRKTKRTFKPNILKKSVMIAGEPVKISICAKCYKNNY